MLTGSSGKTFFIGLDAHELAHLLEGRRLEIKADPKNGVLMPVVLLYGRHRDALVKALEASGIAVKEIIEHDLQEK